MRKGFIDDLKEGVNDCGLIELTARFPIGDDLTASRTLRKGDLFHVNGDTTFSTDESENEEIKLFDGDILISRKDNPQNLLSDWFIKRGLTLLEKEKLRELVWTPLTATISCSSQIDKTASGVTLSKSVSVNISGHDDTAESYRIIDGDGHDLVVETSIIGNLVNTSHLISVPGYVSSFQVRLLVTYTDLYGTSYTDEQVDTCTFVPTDRIQYVVINYSDGVDWLSQLERDDLITQLIALSDADKSNLMLGETVTDWRDFVQQNSFLSSSASMITLNEIESAGGNFIAFIYNNAHGDISQIIQEGAGQVTPFEKIGAFSFTNTNGAIETFSLYLSYNLYNGYIPQFAVYF